MKIKERGITLIALVITIVILLILAGITINQLTGENGLFARAKQAKEETQIESDKEEIGIKYAEYMQEKIIGELEGQTFLEFLGDSDKGNKEGRYIVEYLDEEDHEIGYVTIENRKYLVDTTDGNLNIQYIGKASTNIPIITKVSTSATNDTISVEIKVSREDAQIEYAISKDGQQIGETVEKTETTHTFDGLTGGQTYTIIIIVKNENGSTYKTINVRTVTLKELVEGKAKFIIIPNTEWQKSVTAKIESTYTPTSGIELQYSIGDENNWQKYTTEFEVTTNTILYGRYYNTKTGEESNHFTLEITIIDEGKPIIEATFDQTEMKLKVSVQDTKSGLASVKVNKLTSETTSGTITSTEVENKTYTGTTEKQEFEETIKAPYQQYLRGYEIIATDKAGNETTFTVNNLSIQNLSLIITTEQELIEFASLVNSGTTFEGQTVQLGNSITMTKDFRPIGDNNTTKARFNGTFNGNGYTISNLKIPAKYDNTGLFGYTGTSSNITNLKLENCDIKGNGVTGGLVGVNCGNISLIGVKGSILGNGTYTGGIVGRQKSSGKIIEKCYVEGSVSGSTSTGYTGGIVGRAFGEGENTIQNVYSNAAISGYMIAGIVTGDASPTIKNSYATGKLTGNESVAGICLSSGAPTTNTFWDKETTGTSNGKVTATGLSTENMKKASTYSAWDKTIWNIEDESYPTLKITWK